MRAYKGFDKNLCCRGFQYEEGKTYETDKASLCNAGFHACEEPLNTWDYYPPVDGNQFREVELDGLTDEKSNDSKRCGTKITIGAEIGISGLVKAHVEYVKEQIKGCNSDPDNDSSGCAAKIGSSGDAAKIGSSGHAAQIGSSGYAAKIGSSGHAAKIGSSGYAAKIGSSGYAAQIGSSGYAAKIGSSGRYAKIGSSGDDVMITCDADHAVIACAGKNAKIKAPLGTWFSLAEFGDWDGNGFPCLCMKAEKIDGETLKADTWYKLENGEFTEVNDDEE